MGRSRKFPTYRFEDSKVVAVTRHFSLETSGPSAFAVKWGFLTCIALVAGYFVRCYLGASLYLDGESSRPDNVVLHSRACADLRVLRASFSSADKSPPLTVIDISRTLPTVPMSMDLNIERSLLINNISGVGLSLAICVF